MIVYFDTSALVKSYVAENGSDVDLVIERSLRGYDALHLAAALAWQEHLSEPVTLA